jgi:hypothetical protein
VFVSPDYSVRRCIAAVAIALDSSIGRAAGKRLATDARRKHGWNREVRRVLRDRHAHPPGGGEVLNLQHVSVFHPRAERAKHQEHCGA